VKEMLRRYWKWILAGVAVLFLIVQYGGVTVVVVNRVYKPICEIHISASTEADNWGPNRIWSQIPSPQSRDIRLPIYMNWFHPSGQRLGCGLSGHHYRFGIICWREQIVIPLGGNWYKALVVLRKAIYIHEANFAICKEGDAPSCIAPEVDSHYTI
jgi:hypothetical protein